MSNNYSKIINDGLWKNNPGLVQLLGLCPLLAVSNSVVNALGLGLATVFVLVVSNFTVSLIRNYVGAEIRIPVFVMIIAAAVTVTELLMQSLMYDLYLILGIFIPLITTNCAIIARAEAFASKNNVPASILDGLMMGLGFTAVLVILGAIRELLGYGTLFNQMDLLLGPWATVLSIEVISDYPGFLLAILPPGAFLALGLLIALKNWIDARYAKRLASKATQESHSAIPVA